MTRHINILNKYKYFSIKRLLENNFYYLKDHYNLLQNKNQIN